jgi:hypothetical protein
MRLVTSCSKAVTCKRLKYYIWPFPFKSTRLFLSSASCTVSFVTSSPASTASTSLLNYVSNLGLDTKYRHHWKNSEWHPLETFQELATPQLSLPKCDMDFEKSWLVSLATRQRSVSIRTFKRTKKGRTHYRLVFPLLFSLFLLLLQKSHTFGH